MSIAGQRGLAGVLALMLIGTGVGQAHESRDQQQQQMQQPQPPRPQVQMQQQMQMQMRMQQRPEPRFEAIATRPIDRVPRESRLPVLHAEARRPPSPSDFDREFSVSLGVERSRGDFSDSERSDLTFIPLGFRYRQGAVTARLTVPYLSLRGPSDVVGGLDGGLALASGSGTRRTEKGLGDVVAGLSYAISPPLPGLPFIELSGRVKLPTADEDDGLGTGKADYTAEMELSRSFGSFTPFGSLGYRVLGDPSGVDLKNGFLGSLGFSYRFNPSWTGGLVYDVRQRSADGVEGSRELVPFLAYRVSRSLQIESYAVRGMSDASPDFSYSMNARVTW